MDRRRNKILEAARSIIETEGVQGLSVRQLANRSGLVVKTLYNLYGSKENILVSLIEQGTAEVDATIATAAVSLSDFTSSISALEDVVLRSATILKPAMLASFHLSGARDTSALAMHKRRSQAIEAALSAAQDNGLIRIDTDAHVVAWLLYRSYVEVLTDWAFGVLSDQQFKDNSRFAVLTSLHAFVTPEIIHVVDAEIANLQSEIALGASPPI